MYVLRLTNHPVCGTILRECPSLQSGGEEVDCIKLAILTIRSTRRVDWVSRMKQISQSFAENQSMNMF